MYLIKMKFQMIVGNNIEEDCLCDSEYMLNIMPKVVVTIRENFHCIPREKTIFSHG